MTYSEMSPKTRLRMLVRGDSFRWKLTCTSPNPSPGSDAIGPRFDLTGVLIIFTMKLWRADGGSVSTDRIIIRKSSDDTDEISVLDQLSDVTIGQCVIKGNPDDTQYLEPGVYRYDIRLHLTNGERITVISDEIYVRGDVGSAEDNTTP
jgi:hypothetical protein